MLWRILWTVLLGSPVSFWITLTLLVPFVFPTASSTVKIFSVITTTCSKKFMLAHAPTMPPVLYNHIIKFKKKQSIPTKPFTAVSRIMTFVYFPLAFLKLFCYNPVIQYSCPTMRYA